MSARKVRDNTVERRIAYQAARAAGDDAAALRAADDVLSVNADLERLESREEELELAEVSGDTERLGCALDTFVGLALRIVSSETTPDAVRLGVCRRAYLAWQRTEGRTWRA